MGRKFDKRKSNRKAKVLTAKHRQSVEMLMRLGIWQDFGESLRGDRRRVLLEYRFPKLRIELGTDDSADQEVVRILKELTDELDAATFSCPIVGESLVQDYFSVVLPLVVALCTVCRGNIPEGSPLHLARARVINLVSPDTVRAAVASVYSQLNLVLIKYCRFDKCLYWLSHSGGWKSNGKYHLVLRLNAMAVDPISISLDSKERRAYRCGQPCGPGGIDFVEWGPPTVKSSDDRTYPVYVQQHALDNLLHPERGRLNFLADGDWALYEHLWQSLRFPTIVSVTNGEYLVEYKFFGWRLGYLIAVRAADRIVVRTFLFLTMNGTPEGNLLWSRLRLRRADKEYLGLDSIHVFLGSDLQNDTELVSLLTECGCGHLFQLLAPGALESVNEGYARDMRKHLGLDT